MDLEMIQDLLGEPSLPPPPSVQDLLGDVEPIARSPSPPLPSLPCPEEHSYSKVSYPHVNRFLVRQVSIDLSVLERKGGRKGEGKEGEEERERERERER